jgi:hypothetical protein
MVVGLLEDMIELRDKLAATINRDGILPEPGLGAFDRAERLKLLAKFDGDIIKIKARNANRT